MRILIATALCAATTFFAAPAGLAFANPADAGVTTIVVPYGAGGPLDTTARALGDAVRDAVGTVIVENRPGAGGNIGLGHVARATPNGRTLGVGAVATLAINSWLYDSLPFDADTDFAVVTPIARVPNVLVMNAERAQALNIASLADLIAYAKANPGTLNYGSGGNGSAGHLAGELFKRLAEVDAVHVPYNGANPAQLALLSQEVDFNFDNLAAASANVRAGKLLALAVTTAEPSTFLPGVPTVADTLPGFAIDTWWGLVAPAGTPPETLQKLNAAFSAALESEKIQAQFEALQAAPMIADAAAFAQFVANERQRYEAIVRQAGAKAE